MTPRRNTRTGGVLERMILPALDQGGYSYTIQVNIGQRLGVRAASQAPTRRHTWFLEARVGPSGTSTRREAYASISRGLIK